MSQAPTPRPVDTRTGHQIIEDALAKASLIDPKNSPFPMAGEFARAYQLGLRDAYQHSLEMIPASSMGVDPEEVWDEFIEKIRIDAGAEKVVNIIGGVKKLKAMFVSAAERKKS